MTENEPDLEPLGEDARITSLDERLKQAQSEEDVRTGRRAAGAQVVRTAGAKILQDLIGIPLGCAVIGFIADQLLKTTPWVMLALMFIGFGIAVRSVMKDSKQPPE